MPTLLDEQTPFSDVNGKPLVNGKIFIGEKGEDPVTFPILIFANRELTTVLANPQTLDSFGRSVNKIWIPDKYSLKVVDTGGSQKLLDLDAGGFEEGSAEIIQLNNIRNGDQVLADATPPLTVYVDKTQYIYAVFANNNGPQTMNIDGVGERPLVGPAGLPLSQNEVLTNNIQNMNYDLGNDRFQLLGGGFSGILGVELDTNGFPINNSIYNVASTPTTSDIWASPGGLFINFTGTATITDFPTAPRAGANRFLVCTGAMTFVFNANIFVHGLTNYTASVGDFVHVLAFFPGSFFLTIQKADGTAVKP